MRVADVPVVLLHGVGLDDSMWDPLLAQEVLAGRTVVPVELPGHGRRPPLRRATTLTEMAADVAERLPSRSHMVGFSLGALVAQELAAGSPERVVTFTCVSSVCQRSVQEAAAVRGRLESARDDFKASVEAAIQRWFPETYGVPGDQIERIRAVLLANDQESYLHAYEVFASGDQQIAARLPLITAPILAVTGGDDPGSTPEMTRRLGRVVPRARAVVVPGVRHMFPIERPGELARLIAEFVDDAERTATRAHPA